jgi:hypothetical protein
MPRSQQIVSTFGSVPKVEVADALLSIEEQALLHSLSQPIDPPRRPEFMQAVARELANAGAVGPGVLHRTAREIVRQFWTPPADLRQGRSVPRI